MHKTKTGAYDMVRNGHNVFFNMVRMAMVRK